MMNTLCKSATILVAGLLLAFSGATVAVAYTFTNIADTTSPVFPFRAEFPQGPSINNAGSVTFSGGLAAGGQGVFTGSGGPTTTIADSSGPFSFFFSPPSINNAGAVAFSANLDAGGQGVFTGSGGPITTIADTNGSFSGFLGGPSINDAGTVAFSAGLKGGGSGIFTGRGGPITTIADSSGPFSIFSGVPSINSAGTVAFAAATSQFQEQGIFTGSGGPITTIADSRGPFSFFGSSPSINNSGTVAFLASLDAGGSGIFTGSGGPITIVADTTGPFSGFGGGPAAAPPGPSINDAGTVAFLASLDAGGLGLFTGPDPLLDKVINVGDPLFGSIVTSLAVGPDDIFRGLASSSESLNDNVQLAFFYALADRRFGIARADPLTRVPEPASLALLGIGLAAMVCVQRRKR